MKNIDKNASYTWECLPESIPIRGNVVCSGDPIADEQVEKHVYDQLSQGNNWAWCTIKCTASIQGTSFQGVDYLVCCSYKSFSDFIESDEYVESMKSQALADLKQAIITAEREIDLVRCL